MLESFDLVEENEQLGELIAEEEAETRPASPANVFRSTLIHSIRRSSPLPAEIQSGKYKGNGFSGTTRLRFHYGKTWEGGLIRAKDAGEPDYFDHFGGYIACLGSRFQLIMGNFKLQNGSGLLFANPYANMKSSAATTVFRKNSLRLKPSLSRSGFMTHTGVATRFALSDQANLVAIHARNRHDAYITDDSPLPTGINFNNYHRSEYEIASKHRLFETQTALIAALHYKNRFTLTAGFSRLRFIPGIDHSAESVGENRKRRSYFAFSGDKLTMAGISYHLSYKTLYLSGESALSDFSDPGFAHSLFIKKKSIRFGLRHWYVSPAFQSPYGGVFDEGAAFPQAVSGWYLALRARPFKRITFNAYTLLSRDLWRTFFEPFPVQKTDRLVAMEYKNAKHRLRLRYRESQRFEYTIVSSGKEKQVKKETKTVRIDHRLTISNSMRLRSRWERKQVHPAKISGTALFQDIRISFRPALQVRLRASVFKTDGYAACIYEYEDDLPYAFSNYPLYGEGHKYAALLKYQWEEDLSVWFKWRYLDQTNEGTRTLKREYKVMVKWTIN